MGSKSLNRVIFARLLPSRTEPNEPNWAAAFRTGLRSNTANPVRSWSHERLSAIGTIDKSAQVLALVGSCRRAATGAGSGGLGRMGPRREGRVADIVSMIVNVSMLLGISDIQARIVDTDNLRRWDVAANDIIVLAAIRKLEKWPRSGFRSRSGGAEWGPSRSRNAHETTSGFRNRRGRDRSAPPGLLR